VTYKKIWIIEAGPIYPDRDAGSRCILDLYDGIKKLGIRCQILSETEEEFGSTISLNQADLFILSRPGLAARFLNKFPHIKNTIYFGHDLHFQRIKSENKIENIFSNKNEKVMHLVEEICWKKSQIILYPAAKESEYVNNFLGMQKAITIPIYSFEVNKKIVKKRRKSLVFVGGESHKPNRDGVIWFIEKVWPMVKGIHEIELIIIGSWSDAIVSKYRDDQIKFMGNLDEKNMTKVVMSAGIGIAPLRFGAGVKRKVLQYCHSKIPVVTTEFGVEGLDYSNTGNTGIYIVKTEAEYVENIKNLLENVLISDEAGYRNYKFVMSKFSNKIYLETLKSVLS
jgi:glycosyltransferase involved in cell wall biosynthesis